MLREPEQFLHADRQLRARLRPRSRSARASRTARSKCVGASASSRRRSFQGSSALNAASNSSVGDLVERGLAAQHRRQPVARRLRASAASDRSGHSSPSARRRNMTRSRHCRSALLHGNLSMPSCAMPSASMRAVSSVGGNRLAAARRAPARRAGALRRARSAADRGIESHRLAVVDLVGKARLDLGERDRRRQHDAACRRACRSVRRRPGTARAPAARPDRHGRRGHWRAGTRRCRRRGFWRCGRDRRAQQRAGATSSRISPAPARGVARAQRFAIAPRFLGAARAVAAELIEPMRADRHRRRRGRAR